MANIYTVWERHCMTGQYMRVIEKKDLSAGEVPKNELGDYIYATSWQIVGIGKEGINA